MYTFVLVMIAGVSSGFLSGLLGIGGGIITVPVLIYVFRLEPIVAIGTSLCVIFPTALIGSFLHHMHGNVKGSLLLYFLPLSLIGAFIGVKVAAHLPGDVLKKVFALVFLVISVKMFFSK
ncbi:MAG: sulfite exporter TauE/SafE family protein [Candidatus Auribacterota bacterium]